ncbi:MAG: flavodoxin family protein [Oscillospiraceae bacterium]|nr:flavodoxin family protein [Oscillospiraceae bacterium]
MYLVITASPNENGLTAACGRAACDSVTNAGREAEIIDLCAGRISPCLVCNDGWGTCLPEAKCVIGDMMDALQAKIRAAEGIFLVTPVYFGQPNERMQYFLDRFRRMECFNKAGSAAKGKMIHLIAAAGGGGAGGGTCLAEMEMWCSHVGAVTGERFDVTRANRGEVIDAIRLLPIQ